MPGCLGATFMVWRSFSIPVAGLLGPMIILATVLRNWHGWAAAPFWLDDIAAGLFVLGAAIFAYRDQGSIRGRLVTGALGASVAVLWASLFEVPMGLHPRPDEWSAFPSVALFVTAAAFMTSLFGFAISLPSKRPPVLGTRPEKKKARR
ncbi:hypothetical protein MCEMIH16_00256 [Caulobacteraceae bacterium]